MQEAKGGNPKYIFFPFPSQMNRRVCSPQNGLLEYSENLENFKHMRSLLQSRKRLSPPCQLTKISQLMCAVVATGGTNQLQTSELLLSDLNQ